MNSAIPSRSLGLACILFTACAATGPHETSSRALVLRFVAFLERDAATFPNGRVTLERMFGEADEVAFWSTCTGNQAGPMGPFPANYSPEYVHHGPEGAEPRGIAAARSIAAAILASSSDRVSIRLMQMPSVVHSTECSRETERRDGNPAARSFSGQLVKR